MNKRIILAFAICLIAAVCLPSILVKAQSKLTKEQQAWVAKAYRFEKDGWIYLHIEGTPEERGFQNGYLMAKEIKEAIRHYKIDWYYNTSMSWPWLVKEAGEIVTPKVDPENLKEIDGIVEGMNAAGDSTTENEIVTVNDIVELSGYWFPSIKDSLKINSVDPPKESCSSFIATGSMTSDGKIVLGHNTMDSYQNPPSNIIIDIVPDKGHRILMQTSAGLIHSCTDFFITDAGIVGSETTISGFYPFDVHGIPEFSRMRTATQYANSIDEWCAIMKKGNNGGYANAWLLGDIKTNEIARLELGLHNIGFEKKKDGYFTGSNRVVDIKILRRETKEPDTNIKASDIARRVRWHQLMKEYAGKINIDIAEKMEADHYDTYLNKVQPGGRSICGHFDLDPQYSGISQPFYPLGTIDGKVVDANMAKHMTFMARWGSACGMAFDAKKFLEEHPQYDWMSSILNSRPSEPWTEFKAGENEGE